MADQGQAQAQGQQPNIQQVQQMQMAKVSNALNTTLLLFETEINVPIKLNDGLADLKWLVRALLSGQFNIDMDPTRQLAGRPLDTKLPIKEPSETEGANGEDKETS